MTKLDLSELLSSAVKLSDQASRLLLDKRGDSRITHTKESISDITSTGDLEAEELYTKSLREQFPSHSLLCEESGLVINDPDFCWVVDPLDGTSNYMAGLPWYASMITLVHKGEPVIGVISLPEFGRTYSCAKGQGVFLNGARLAPLASKTPSDSLLAVGFASEAGQVYPGFPAMLMAISKQVRGVRMTNSAYDFGLCMDGSVQGVVNFSTKLWDIAAAALMLPEMGFCMGDLSGNPLNFDITRCQYPYHAPIVATAPEMYASLVEICREGE